jgi:hypothetical protein
VAEARGESGVNVAAAAAKAPAKPDAAGGKAQDDASQTAASSETASKGVEAARRSVETAKGDGANQRFALGATTGAKPTAQPAAATTETAEQKPPAASPPVKLLNGQPAEPKADAPLEVASIAGMAKEAGKPEKSEKAEKPEKTEKTDAKAANSKCRVWTASYGGSKAIIIKALAEKTVNYTVLDVNEGTEKREADAYISAYAKGGESVGEFQSQSQALEKAFELCPEG